MARATWTTKEPVCSQWCHFLDNVNTLVVLGRTNVLPTARLDITIYTCSTANICLQVDILTKQSGYKTDEQIDNHVNFGFHGALI